MLNNGRKKNTAFQEGKEKVVEEGKKAIEGGKKVADSLFEMDQPGNKLLPKLLTLAAKVLYVLSLVPVVLLLFNLGFGFRVFLISLMNAAVGFATIFVTALLIQAVARILIAVEKE